MTSNGSDTYELVVLGGGTGGYSCALPAATLGMRVAVVEKGKVGGVCLHSGCIPTKALLQTAEVAEHARDARHYGVDADFQGMDMAAVLAYQKRIVDTNWKGLRAILKARGVEVIAGTGHVQGPRSLVVDTEEGQRSITAGRALVLATGSVPRALPVEGANIDGERIITSDHALFLPHVPQRPIVVGGGAVGLELATAWNTFGAEQVTVVEALDGVLPGEDGDTRAALARELKKRRIDVLTSTTVTRAEIGAGGVRVSLRDRGGVESTLEGDVLLVSVGRRPVTDGMGFENAGVRLDKGYVLTDDHCQAADGVYAVGDILPTLGLAHASFQEGFLAAEHAAGHRVMPIDYAGVPRVTYCHPEVGSVGLTEEQATQQGIDYEVERHLFTHNARAMMARTGGQVKVMAAKKDGRVVGVHIVGPRATDLIAEGQLIYNWEASPHEVAAFIHAHPTLAEVVGEAHLALAGKPLHG
jgi:dihydrolipoamide dehydrogenase